MVWKNMKMTLDSVSIHSRKDITLTCKLRATNDYCTHLRMQHMQNQECQASNGKSNVFFVGFHETALTVLQQAKTAQIHDAVM